MKTSNLFQWSAANPPNPSATIFKKISMEKTPKNTMLLTSFRSDAHCVCTASSKGQEEMGPGQAAAGAGAGCTVHNCQGEPIHRACIALTLMSQIILASSMHIKIECFTRNTTNFQHPPHVPATTTHQPATVGPTEDARIQICSHLQTILS